MSRSRRKRSKPFNEYTVRSHLTVGPRVWLKRVNPSIFNVDERTAPLIEVAKLMLIRLTRRELFLLRGIIRGESRRRLATVMHIKLHRLYDISWNIHSKTPLSIYKTGKPRFLVQPAYLVGYHEGYVLGQLMRGHDPNDVRDIDDDPFIFDDEESISCGEDPEGSDCDAGENLQWHDVGAQECAEVEL